MADTPAGFSGDFDASFEAFLDQVVARVTGQELNEEEDGEET